MVISLYQKLLVTMNRDAEHIAIWYRFSTNPQPGNIDDGAIIINNDFESCRVSEVNTN